MISKARILRVIQGLTTAFTLAALPSVTAPTQEKRLEHEVCSTFAGRPVPRYKIPREERTKQEPFLTLYVVLKPIDINRQSLLALACSLGHKYSAQHDLVAFIFDSSRAAKKYFFLHEGNSAETERSHRATYSFLHDQSYHTLEWCPDPDKWFDKNQWVTIDLGKPPTPPKR